MAIRLRHAEDDLGESHEINVTPFIDVVLVLLIIFMVGAPLATVDMAVDLPTSTAKPSTRPDNPVFLTLKADHALALGDRTLALKELPKALDAEFRGDRGQRVFLQADKTVNYGDLMAVMNVLRNAGYLKIALVGLEAPPAP